MEKLVLRLEQAGKALKKLSELIDKDSYNDIERDAIILRFQFCYELLWKCGKDYLRVQEGIDSASPRKVIRDCQMVGILSEEDTELALKMVDDRNMTAHIYDEDLAQKLAGRISGYAELMQMWYQRMGDTMKS